MQIPFFVLLAGLLLSCLPLPAADAHVLDDPASPVRVEFDSAGGRITVTGKSSEWKWVNPSSGGNPLSVAGVKQAGPLKLGATAATSSGARFTLSLELEPAAGELTVAISGDETGIPNGLFYPDPFFAADGSGFSVFPTHGGYVIPTSEVGLRRRMNALADNQMEWFRGTDAANERAWIAVVETPDDWSLNAATGTVGSVQVVGPVPRWHGSNNNPGKTPSLLSYERRLRYRFLASGGYAAMAKHFRQHPIGKGWSKSLTEKLSENPLLERLLGAPVIYLWGDRRSTVLLREMKESGIEKALIQISVNHLDRQNKFPNAESPDNDGWAKVVRAHGYVSGFHDMYSSVTTSAAPRYDGFHYLWPPDVSEWAYVNANPGPPARGVEVCAQMQESFARETRLPAHLPQFEDHVDRLAMLRGQAPLLNLVYRGEQGAARRTPNTATDARGNAWTTRWSVTKDRVKQTYDTVCRWHEKVGLLEMIDHRWLTADRSVQMAEFSADGGASGHKIVVNFGVYDGAYGLTGVTWEGTVMGRPITAAPGNFGPMNGELECYGGTCEWFELS